MEEKEYILSEIQKSGLPTEYFTRKLLKKYAFTTTSQVPYIDQETEKYRALDILAEIYDSRAKTSIILYIECKKVRNN